MCARVCVEMNTYDCIKRSSVVCFVWENNEEEEKKKEPKYWERGNRVGIECGFFFLFEIQ